MENGIIRQGDILLVPVDETPTENAERVTEAILAEGEVTGHAHRLRGDVLTWMVGGELRVRVVGNDAGTLQHEDHDPAPVAVVVPERTYRVVRQREWDLSGQWRQVAD